MKASGASPSPQHRPRTWGFRFSLMDGAVLALGAVATAAGMLALEGAFVDFAALGAFALGHFFLFCNVFRVRREPELIWTAVFILNAAGWELLGDGLTWRGVVAVQTPITLALLLWEIRHPRYHGIFARRLNPRHLDDYLAGRIP
jgi:hypothetical protein